MFASATPVIRLVAREKETDLVTLVERHHEVCVFLTGNTKNELDAFGFQTANKQIGSFHEIIRPIAATETTKN